MITTGPWLWVAFITFIVGMLAIDLGVLHRHSRVVGMREGAIWAGVCITLSCLFGAWVTWQYGSEKGAEFFAGYLIEKSLSLDNVFVFVVIFAYFGVPRELQHRVLFYGVLGALIMRGIFIILGVALIEQFHWILYVFGGILLITAFKLFNQDLEQVDPGKNPILRLARKMLPATNEYHGNNFFIERDGKRLATPLLFVLITVEASDLIFAVDSIPAVFAVSRDPFIIFTSNVFAILCLRALFFVVSGALYKLRYLRYGLAIVLGFVGTKMLLVDIYKIPIGWSLSVIAGVLTAAIVASLCRPSSQNERASQNESASRNDEQKASRSEEQKI